jgi:hypothetical protein
MDMDKKSHLIIIALALLLAGCQNQGTATTAPTLDATALNQTAVSQATADAEKTQSAPTAPVTPEPTQTWTPVPTLDRTRPSNSTPTPEIPCNQAAAGHPIDVTIPDGTVLTPGESFSKTWRLENVGSCDWTRFYAVTFFSGNSLNAIQTQNLAQDVAPGQTIDLTVDMEAPMEPGIYQSNWMFSDASGALFGIGPNGDAPFWVRIEVVQEVTDTPTPTPTVTSTPVVYLTGGAALAHESQLDLDSGTLNPGDATQSDLVYQNGGDPAHILMTMNGTQWAVFGEAEPTFGECSDAALSGNALSFAEVPTGTYLCYQTSGQLPGWLRIGAFAEGALSVQFLTWAVP